MAWIEKRGNKRVVRWHTINPDGTKTTHASGRLTEPKAKALVKKLGAKIPDRRQRKRGVRITDYTIAFICAQWHAHKVIESEQSINYADEASAKAQAVAEAAGVTHVSELTGEVIRAYRLATGSSVDRSLAYLRAIVAWSVDEYDMEVDQRFFAASRPRPSKESEARLLTDTEHRAICDKAQIMEQWPLIHCLQLYGWRPITACRIQVGHVNLTAATIRLQVKRQSKPHVHPLFPESVDLLRPLCENRPDDAPLFLSRMENVWRTRGDSADGLTRWYADNLGPLAPDTGGTNALKRWAIHAMKIGLPPWPRALTSREIRLFTGHKTDSQVARYERHSASEALQLVTGICGSDVVEVMKPDAILASLLNGKVGQSDLKPDESMPFAT